MAKNSTSFTKGGFKGERPNAGRPRKGESFKDLYNEKLDAITELDKDTDERITLRELLVRKHLRAAQDLLDKDDDSGLMKVIERTEGKPQQQIDTTITTSSNDLWGKLDDYAKEKTKKSKKKK